MADGDILSAEDIAGWLTPAETLAVVQKSKGTLAVSVIIERLRGGVLTAIASSTARALGRGTPGVQKLPQRIPASYWQSRTDDGFWTSGDVHFLLRDGRAINPPTNVWCYDIRFDPLVIAEMFPPPPELEPRVVPSTEALAAPDPGTPKKPLPPAALKAWYEAYKLAYPEAERTLEHAYTRARSAFPDKHVVRDRIRELIPAGTKTGPKGPRRNG